MSEYLFKVQQYNRLSQKGLLKRFSINCYGHQHTLEKIRDEKAQKYKELKRGGKEWDFYFLKYDPGHGKEDKEEKREKTRKHKPKRKTRKRRKRRKRRKSRKLFGFL